MSLAHNLVILVTLSIEHQVSQVSRSRSRPVQTYYARVVTVHGPVRLHPTRSQSQFFAKRKDRTHIAIPRKQSRKPKCALRAEWPSWPTNHQTPMWQAFRLVGQVVQVERLGQPIEEQTRSRITNGVGRSNFKIGPLSTLNLSSNPKANFEI